MITRHAKRVVMLILGWILVVLGVLALVLPGPGLLMIFAGLAILSQYYTWAEKRLRPIEIKAMQGAAASVKTKGRVAVTVFFALCIMACGGLWLWGPEPPDWWPLHHWMWLAGGRATGVTFVISSLVALGLVIWSYRKFHNKPEAVARIEEFAAGR